mmetsp:Transcript_21478/g.61341  ORF Transcript_21478/g.61341 Transcript_21478/m.61341 type:complete len:544 (+) Transcript_21478:56-1687(+)
MGQGTSGVSCLNDRYFLQKVRLGHGSFGTVWRAIDRQNGNVVAMKQLDKAKLRRQGVRREDVEREIAMMKACAHDNIAQLFDTFEDASCVYIAQEYCDGGDFGDKLRERGLSILEKEAATWLRQMCSAISALHMLGICHRDIKPDNFMLLAHEALKDGTASSGTLKLADFGLAVFVPRGGLLGQKCGTPAYMAPEQHLIPRRSRGYSFPADVWAAGVSLYQVMFGGLHPFLDEKGRLKEEELLRGEVDMRPLGADGQPLRGESQQFPPEAAGVLRSMLEINPSKRINAYDVGRTRWLMAQQPRRSNRGMSQPHAHAVAGSAHFAPASRRFNSPGSPAASRLSWNAVSPQWLNAEASPEHSIVARSPPVRRTHRLSPSPPPAAPSTPSLLLLQPRQSRTVSAPTDGPTSARSGAGAAATQSSTASNGGEGFWALRRSSTEPDLDGSDSVMQFVAGAKEVFDTTAEVHRSLTRILFGGCGRGSPRRRTAANRSPQRGGHAPPHGGIDAVKATSAAPVFAVDAMDNTSMLAKEDTWEQPMWAKPLR